MAFVLVLLVSLLAFPTSTLEAQAAGVVEGSVVSQSSGNPLTGVQVAVRRASDSTVVAGGVTSAAGRFRISGLPPGRYVVEATRVGYESFVRRDVAITAASPTATLGTIRLGMSALAISGLEVRGQRSDVVVTPDRTVYSTRDIPVAAGGMATDVLRSVPELEVDIEGNVQLRGTGAQIYLNGRPAPMQGESLNQFLQQFPADRIDRVEIIANPSARFEAEGSAGIVNIVLKKNVSLGLSGSVFLNGGTRGDVGSGARLTYQQGPFTLFGGGFFRVGHRDNASSDFRQNLVAQPVTFLQQEGWSRQRGSMGNVDLTAEYKLSGKSTLWSEVRLFQRGNESDGLTEYTHLDAFRLPTQRYDRARDGDQSALSTDLNLGFRHVIEQQKHELEFEVSMDDGTEDDATLIRRRFFAPNGDDSGLPEELTYENETDSDDEINLEADYVRPLGEKGQLEIGYRGDLETVENGRILEIFSDETAASPISSTDLGFGHQENFHSLYLTVMRTFGSLGIQAGLRGERADTRLELPAGEAFDNDYASLFPSANLRYDLGSGRDVRLSYSKRIQRPGPWILNPINRSSDPLNRSIGNPDIDPAYTHNVSLETSWSGQRGTLRLSPYYRRTVDDWTQIKSVDAQGISTVTWENLASVESYGTSLTASLRPVRGVGGFASISGNREVRDASNLSQDFSGANLRWSARGNVQARLLPSLNLQGMLYYQPARDVPQGRISSSVMTHLGLRQQLLNNKVSVNLMLSDPLDLHRSSFETRDRTHIQTGTSRYRMRSGTLSFSYSFGRPPRSARSGGQGEGEGAQQEEPAQEIR